MKVQRQLAILSWLPYTGAKNWRVGYSDGFCNTLHRIVVLADVENVQRVLLTTQHEHVLCRPSLGISKCTATLQSAASEPLSSWSARCN